MKTLSEEYTINFLYEVFGLDKKTGYAGNKKETKGSRALKYGAINATGNAISMATGAGMVGIGGGVAASALGPGAMAAYYLYRKHKQAKMKADMEKDPAKKNALNAKANQIKQDANKKKLENQKKEMLQKRLMQQKKQ